VDGSGPNVAPIDSAGDGAGGEVTKMIEYTLAGPVAVITLNRPEARNAQNDAFLLALDAAWTCASEDEEARVIVLQAKGPHFSAGHDLKSYHRDAYGGDGTEPRKDLSRAYRWEAERFFNACRRWSNVPKPSIAAVHGACIGAGLMLCWPCDLIIAADDARFSDPVVRLGANGIEYHAHAWEFGARKAKELLFTGGALTAHDALGVGMVNRVVARERLHDETMKLAREIAQMDPFGLAQAKRSVNLALDIGSRWAALQANFDVHWTTHGRSLSVSGGSDSLMSDLDQMRRSNRT
jgi:enoyl-CoA hydratase